MPLKPNKEAYEAMEAKTKQLTDDQKIGIFHFLMGYMRYQDNLVFIEAVNKAIRIS